VARFLSEEWFTALASLLDGLELDPSAAPLHLGQEISGSPEGTVRYTIHVEGGHASLERGSLERAGATLVEDYQTAAAVATGSPVSEQLSLGRIKLRGNPNSLVEAQAALEAISEALAEAELTSEV
jgi:hypothetical protein